MGGSARRRAAKGATWREWYNDAVSTLNDMYHCDPNDAISPPPGLPPRARSGAEEYIAQQYRDFELPPGYSESPLRCEAALGELLASAPGYSGESRVRPYNKELVSWPKHVAP
eukprot:8505984-Pyramimonas_sp.AAC.1